MNNWSNLSPHISLTRLKIVRTIQKALFRLTRNMMGDSGDKILPVHTCKRKLANVFKAFFTNNIEHKEQTRIDKYTYRRIGDKLFF